MAARTALVVGPTGAIGSAVVRALAAEGGWTVYGLSRTAPATDTGWTHVAADLLDRTALPRALAALPDAPSHLVYAARAPHGEGSVEDVDANRDMLVNVVTAAEAAGALRHVHLVEGTKWYGVHLGPYRTPAEEDQPRHLPPNFYYDQEDALAELQRGKAWTWSASRPNVVCDFAPGRARNLVTVIGAYAAICRELAVPMDFPGTEAGFATLTEVTDADHLARAICWMATAPAAANRAFNVTNGDAFRWRYLWPHLAARLDVAPGEPRDLRLGEWMQEKGPVWDRVVARHGLRPLPLADVALWAFGDFVFRQDWDVLSNLTRLRRAGFGAAVDSAEMFATQFARYREARILPPAELGSP